MTPINNSDTAWLIVSDYNQDNNLPYETLREDVHNPDTDQWHWESFAINQGVGVAFDCTIYSMVGQHYVGGFGSSGDFIGGGIACSTEVGYSSAVGGHR
jgi:hypothetical protein